MSAVASAYHEICWFSSVPLWLGIEVGLLDPVRSPHRVAWYPTLSGGQENAYNVPGSSNGKSENNEEVCAQACAL